jgi:hypothetical protein
LRSEETTHGLGSLSLLQIGQGVPAVLLFFELLVRRGNAAVKRLLFAVVSTDVIADLKERSDYPIRTWLQGSYKSATQIRPVRVTEEFDIDLGVYFQWDGRPQDGRYGPKALKSFVQESLKSYAAANATDVEQVMPPRERCCRIQFKSCFHIDVPAYHLDADRDARRLATEAAHGKAAIQKLSIYGFAIASMIWRAPRSADRSST